MRYFITGSNRETGDRMTLEFEAESKAAAERKASAGRDQRTPGGGHRRRAHPARDRTAGRRSTEGQDDGAGREGVDPGDDRGRRVLRRVAAGRADGARQDRSMTWIPRAMTPAIGACR